MSKSGWLSGLLGARGARVTHESCAENVYHCCVHKTASQWIARLLEAPETFRYSGLHAYRYQKDLPGGVDTRKVSERTFDQPFPPKTFVSPLYIGWDNFAKIPKPSSWRAFFVARDPRDIVVSRYFSWKYSHPVMGSVAEERETLQHVGATEGLCHQIRQVQDQGLFEALRSWKVAATNHPEVALFRFEDLTGANQFASFQRLWKHCDIAMPDEELKDLLERNSFAALAGGREQGQEDVKSHLRKGVAGDWKNYFTPEVDQLFRETTGDLLQALGYE